MFIKLVVWKVPEDEAQETRALPLPFRKTKKMSVLVVVGIIEFGFVAVLIPVASMLPGPSAPAGWASVRVSSQ